MSVGSERKRGTVGSRRSVSRVRKSKGGIMKYDELIAEHLGPCVQIFVESLINAELTTNAAGDAGTMKNFVDIKKDSKQPRSER